MSTEFLLKKLTFEQLLAMNPPENLWLQKLALHFQESGGTIPQKYDPQSIRTLSPAQLQAFSQVLGVQSVLTPEQLLTVLDHLHALIPEPSQLESVLEQIQKRHGEDKPIFIFNGIGGVTLYKFDVQSTPYGYIILNDLMTLDQGRADTLFNLITELTVNYSTGEYALSSDQEQRYLERIQEKLGVESLTRDQLGQWTELELPYMNIRREFFPELDDSDEE